MHVKDMFALNGKTAVVTGGAVGLGAQMAVALSEAGANVVIAARKTGRCAEMCARLERNGVRSLAVGCDVSKIADCRELVESTIKEFTRLDILVNNAGVSWVADSLTFPMDKWQRVIDVNLTGTFQLSMLAARVMKEQGGGTIINMASIGGLRGDRAEHIDSVPYSASKGAILAMTRDLAIKWAPYGIRVNAICPGWFPTNMNHTHLEELADRLIPMIPLGRYGGSEDLKGAVVFLSSAASGYMTGQYIVVDGGQTAAA
jgi:NAD(P)-dependent dehydrogenase (short-subunit alcohol dehydrogenase family)